LSDNEDRRDRPLGEVESTERFVANKPEDELLHDLKVYLARLRDDPRSIPDRLRVAAIQARLGRTQEALVHYEGVLRGYVSEDQIMNAIALCRRILGHYPNMPRMQRILAALYARAPRGATGAASPVTPIPPLEEQTTSSFVVEDPEEEEANTDRNVVVDRVFPEFERPRRGTPAAVPRLVQPAADEDMRRTQPYERVLRPDNPPIEEQETTYIVSDDDLEEVEGSPDAAVLLTKPKSDTAPHSQVQPADGDEEMVVLLTRPKKKR
jgi:hypothetical protein